MTTANAGHVCRLHVASTTEHNKTENKKELDKYNKNTQLRFV